MSQNYNFANWYLTDQDEMVDGWMVVHRISRKDPDHPPRTITTETFTYPLWTGPDNGLNQSLGYYTDHISRELYSPEKYWVGLSISQRETFQALFEDGMLFSSAVALFEAATDKL